MEKQKRSSVAPAEIESQRDKAHEKTKNTHEHPPTPKEEESLDRTLEDSFPASDPPSSIPDPDEDAA